MIINDLNFIQIKTKRAPTSWALNSITTEKLKPYYNTVYQLFKLKNPRQKTFQQAKLEIQQKINKKIPQIIKSRRIAQETHEFKITKPFQKRGFSLQTTSSKEKKCKSVTKSFFLTQDEYLLHKQKDDFAYKMETLRKLSKSLSQQTESNKKKYNLMDKYHKMIDYHYKNLQLQAKFMNQDENDQNKMGTIGGNKWIENIVVSTDSQHQSLVRQEKQKYLHQISDKFNLFKGVNDNEVKQCKDIIEQDQDLMLLSLHQEVATTNLAEVKSMYQITLAKLNKLMILHQRSRLNSTQLSTQKKYKSTERVTKSCRFSRKKESMCDSPDYKEYKTYKNSQNQNPQTYRIGDKYSNFQTKQKKKGVMLKLKQHQKNKYTTKVMDLNRHKKLFLKNK